MVLDTRPGKTWQAVGDMVFSEDGKHWGHSVRGAEGHRVVVDKKEGPVFDGMSPFFAFSRDRDPPCVRGGEGGQVARGRRRDARSGLRRPTAHSRVQPRRGARRLPGSGRGRVDRGPRRERDGTLAGRGAGQPAPRPGREARRLRREEGRKVAPRGRREGTGPLRRVPSRGARALQGRKARRDHDPLGREVARGRGRDPGPDFDRLFPSSLGFSEDGAHVAYSGMREGKFLAWIDGKETRPFSGPVSPVLGPAGAPVAWTAVEGEMGILGVGDREMPLPGGLLDVPAFVAPNLLRILLVRDRKHFVVVDATLAPVVPRREARVTLECSCSAFSTPASTMRVRESGNPPTGGSGLCSEPDPDKSNPSRYSDGPGSDPTEVDGDAAVRTGVDSSPEAAAAGALGFRRHARGRMGGAGARLGADDRSLWGAGLPGNHHHRGRSGCRKASRSLVRSSRSRGCAFVRVRVVALGRREGSIRDRECAGRNGEAACRRWGLEHVLHGRQGRRDPRGSPRSRSRLGNGS